MANCKRLPEGNYNNNSWLVVWNHGIFRLSIQLGRYTTNQIITYIITIVYDTYMNLFRWGYKPTYLLLGGACFLKI